MVDFKGEVTYNIEGEKFKFKPARALLLKSHAIPYRSGRYPWGVDYKEKFKKLLSVLRHEGWGKEEIAAGLGYNEQGLDRMGWNESFEYDLATIEYSKIE